MSEQCIDKEYIIKWYNFQACDIYGYRDITPGSELSDHPSYDLFLTYKRKPYSTPKYYNVGTFEGKLQYTRLLLKNSSLNTVLSRKHNVCLI